MKNEKARYQAKILIAQNKRKNIANMIDKISSEVNTAISKHSRTEPLSATRGNTFRTNVLNELNNAEDSDDETIDENQELEYDEMNEKQKKKKRKNTNNAFSENKGIFFVHKKPKNKLSNMSIVSSIKNSGFVRQITMTKAKLFSKQESSISQAD